MMYQDYLGLSSNPKYPIKLYFCDFEYSHELDAAPLSYLAEMN